MKINRVISLISVLVCGLGVTSLAQASMYDRCGGFYAGAQLGYGNLHLGHFSSEDRDFGLSGKDDGLAGRLEAGYNFNQYVALETGAILYTRPRVEFFGNKIDFRQYSVDLLGKFSVPVTCQFSAFAKGGLAWVHRGDLKFTGPDADPMDFNGDDDSDSHIRPMAGVGVSYAFNPRVSAEINYLHTFGTEKHDDDRRLEAAEYYGAGLTIKLG